MSVKPIDKVLITIDTEQPDDAALEAGFEIAAQHGAQVVVLGVAEGLDRVAAMLGDIVPEAELERSFLQQRRRALEQLVAKHRRSTPVRVEAASGVRFVAIIRAAVAEGASLIVQASADDRSHGFTSADWHLLRKSPVPVLIRRKDRPFPPRRIAVAVDVFGHSAEADLNRALLGLAATLSKPWGTPVQVVSAWRLDGERLLESRYLRLDRAEMQRVLDEVAYRARAGHDELRTGLNETDPTAEQRFRWHLEKGDAAAVLPRFAAHHDIDLMLMGTLGRTGIAGLLIGNTAETVLADLECSVLTLKPSPFVTPVK